MNLDKDDAVIVCCGEAIIDLVSTDGIQYIARPGGSALIASIAGARLGGRFAILSRTSSDAFGKNIRSTLLNSGVDLSLIVDASEPSTLAIATIGAGGDATYSFYMDGTADWLWSGDDLIRPWTTEPAALMVGSMSLEKAPSGDHILDLARRAYVNERTTVLYDPNVRLLRGAIGARRAEEVLPFTDIVKASEDDIAMLYPGESPSLIARRWSTLGPQWVILTLGAAGVEIFRSGHGPQCVEAPKTSVSDTIGAGDTFCAALLVALAQRQLLGAHTRSARRELKDERLIEILRFACTAASMTCERIGADPPWKAAVDARLQGATSAAAETQQMHGPNATVGPTKSLMV